MIYVNIICSNSAPSDSGVRRKTAMSASSHFVGESGVVFVAFFFVATSHAAMTKVACDTVGPAVGDWDPRIIEALGSKWLATIGVGVSIGVAIVGAVVSTVSGPGSIVGGVVVGEIVDEIAKFSDDFFSAVGCMLCWSFFYNGNFLGCW